MLTPFQEILKEFEVVDGSDVEHICIVLMAMAVGVVAGTLVSRRRERALTGSQALWRAVIVGIAFPLVTCAILVALRLTPYGGATGALPKFAVLVFASLVVIRLIARVLPLVEQELEAVVIPLGKTHVSALTMLHGLMLGAVTVLGALRLPSMLETRLMATGINMSMRLVPSRFLRSDAVCAGAVDCAGGGGD